ncbi:tol-pal system protein YbgF [Thiomicrospira sp. WB1]|uniref:tol-pal system protein YbgF n=1 Tax=Thiomicrospira sp. WB1 TaxID=1685380 RepID=UPI00074A6BA8|nr:tol-pal system protein YbgF [Thiomicrospira sp. WB1]KUJ72944.1 hypothetical protein AVO41_04005 [Thiomicrospira sp. WB1]
MSGFKSAHRTVCAKGLLAIALALPMVASGAQSLEERVERLERKADNPILVQMSRKLGQQQQQIQEILNQLDLIKHRVEELNQTQTQRYQGNEERISQLEAQIKRLTSQAQSLTDTADLDSASSTLSEEPRETAGDTSNTAADNKPSESVETSSSEQPDAEAKKAYDAAFALLKASKYEAAVEALRAFVQDYASHPLAANAAYWQGEAHSVLGQKEKALAAFEHSFETFPNASKAPDAMLRSGDTLDNLGQGQAAKARYQALIDAHPETRAAEKARGRLQALQQAS